VIAYCFIGDMGDAPVSRRIGLRVDKYLAPTKPRTVAPVTIRIVRKGRARVAAMVVDALAVRPLAFGVFKEYRKPQIQRLSMMALMRRSSQFRSILVGPLVLCT